MSNLWFLDPNLDWDMRELGTRGETSQGGDPKEPSNHLPIPTDLQACH